MTKCHPREVGIGELHPGVNSAHARDVDPALCLLAGPAQPPHPVGIGFAAGNIQGCARWIETCDCPAASSKQAGQSSGSAADIEYRTRFNFVGQGQVGAEIAAVWVQWVVGVGELLLSEFGSRAADLPH